MSNKIELSPKDRKDFKQTLSWFKRFEKNPEGSLSGKLLVPGVSVNLESQIVNK